MDLLFLLRGKLPQKTKTLIEILGAVIIFVVWLVIAHIGIVPKSILPSPIKVMTSFYELHFQDELVRNAGYSIQLNVLGLLEAAIFAFPIGMVIGLFPAFRAVFERYITSARFIPLSATLGIFIAAFGIGTNMKVQFLAFAIFIYLLAVMIQRIDEVAEVYVQTGMTLGANQWQIIKSVFVPATLSKFFDDIRVLSALSWTYIVIAEMINSSGGGVGAIAYMAGRQSRPEKVYGIVVVIVVIGLIQDKLFIYLDRVLFPYKYMKEKK